MTRRPALGVLTRGAALALLLATPPGLAAHAAAPAPAVHVATPAGGHGGGGHGGGGRGGAGHGGGHGGGGHWEGHGGEGHVRTYTTYTFTTIYTPGSPRPARPDDWLSPDQLKELALKPLVADGTPMEVNVGVVSAGEAFFHVGVKHGVTGVLKSDITLTRGFLHRTLPAGLPVYGVPMAGTNDAGIVWCAPQPGRPGADGVTHWSTTCLPLGDSGYVGLESHPAMMTAKLDWSEGAGRAASTPAVDPRPADFPPMILSYVFSGWTREGWLTVEVRLDWGEGPQVLRTISLPPDENGQVIVKAMGGKLAVHAVPGEGAKAVADAAVAVQDAPLPGAPIAY